ncbi:hypothetical protein R6Q59_021888 [Mikania micrantha]
MHFLVLAKCHKVTTTPLLATLVWPFFLKVIMNLRPIKDIVRSMVQDSRLFFFQLSTIIGLDDDNEGSRRSSRIRRLLHHWLANTQRSIALLTDEHSLHTVSMVAL